MEKHELKSMVAAKVDAYWNSPALVAPKDMASREDCLAEFVIWLATTLGFDIFDITDAE